MGKIEKEIEKENINPNDLVISKLATNKQDLFETNNENEIILTYNFNQPTITSKVIGDIIYDSIEMNDLQNNGDVGKPVLPIKPIEILLPYGKALDDIEVITSNKTTLGDGYNIEPAQEPIPLLPKEELEEKYGKLNWKVAFSVSLETAREKFCKFENEIEAIDAGIRIGFSYMTLGVVASPIEGYTGLKLGKTKKGVGLFYCEI